MCMLYSKVRWRKVAHTKNVLWLVMLLMPFHLFVSPKYKNTQSKTGEVDLEGKSWWCAPPPPPPQYDLPVYNITSILQHLFYITCKLRHSLVVHPPAPKKNPGSAPGQGSFRHTM